MRQVITYLLLVTLCIDTFGVLFSEFTHVAVHIIQDSQYNTHLHQINYTHAHSNDALDSQRTSHSHSYSVQLLMEMPKLDEGDAPLTDSGCLNLLMLSLKGIISVTPDFLPTPVLSIDETIAFVEKHFLNVDRQIPYPPPQFLNVFLTTYSII